MKAYLAILIISGAGLLSGCADTRSLGGGGDYGERSGNVSSQSDRDGYITALENIEIDDEYKLGIGTVVGAVAGGVLGAKAGDSGVATAAGAAAGAAAGTYAQRELGDGTPAQRVTVQMASGGQVVIIQPINNNLSNGSEVRVEGSGESARVVRR